MKNIIFSGNKSHKKVIEIIISIIHFLLKLFYKPSNKNWVFSENFGQQYSGNSKYLFEYCLNNNLDTNPIWITRSARIYSELIKQNYPVCSYYSFKGIIAILKAKVFIVTHGSLDIGKICRKNRLLINLWHGVLVKPHVKVHKKVQIKKIGRFKYYYSKFVVYMRVGKIFEDYDLTIAPSNLVKEKMLEEFPFSKKVTVTGTPTDAVLFNPPSRKEILNKYDLSYLDDKIIISYLPTYRDNPEDNKLLFDRFEKIEKLSNCIVILKYHPNYQSFSDKIKTLPKNVLYFDNSNFNDKDLYAISDILITDYSSAFINFLPFNKPLIFYSYDLEYYMENRGYLYNYIEITPGQKVFTEDELMNSLKLLISGKDTFANERKKIFNLFYKYKDINSSARVFKEIKKLII